LTVARVALALTPFEQPTAHEAPVDKGLRPQFAARHLRLGVDANDYDHAREPLCELLNPGMGPYLYQARPTAGQPMDIESLANAWCGCALTAVVKADSVVDVNIQSDNTMQHVDGVVPADRAPPVMTSAMLGGASPSRNRARK
jgi:hypothetical protein